MKSTDIDIEQAVKNIENRFDLILVAAARAREINRGRSSTLDTKTKGPASALLEIQHGMVGKEILKRTIIRKSRR